jgi:GNAT superfamily N-acetyltransferase
VLCIIEGKHLVAAAQWVRTATARHQRGGDQRNSYFSWIVADPEATVGLALLLENIAERARSEQCQMICLSRFAFGAGWPGVSAAWPHLTKGLQQAGYRKRNAWVILTGGTTVPGYSSPASISAIELRAQEARIAAEWVVTAYLGEQPVGECEAWGIPRTFEDCREYAEWITIEWLGVEPPYRRKGLGRFLLREQLRMQAQRGSSTPLPGFNRRMKQRYAFAGYLALLMAPNAGSMKR